MVPFLMSVVFFRVDRLFGPAQHGVGTGVDSALEQGEPEVMPRNLPGAQRSARRVAAVPSIRCTLCQPAPMDWQPAGPLYTDTGIL
jgi:hypothetical protein